MFTPGSSCAVASRKLSPRPCAGPPAGPDSPMACCSRPSPSPKATPTRSPTRSPTRCSTRSSPQDPTSRVRHRDALHDGPRGRLGRGHDEAPTSTSRRSSARPSRRSATPTPRSSSTPTVRRADVHPRAERRHRAGRGRRRRPPRGAGRRRPGHDVRLRVPRNRRADAARDHALAPRSSSELAEIRKAQAHGSMTCLRPDAKSQVTVEYDDDGTTVRRIHTVVISTQHDDGRDAARRSRPTCASTSCPPSSPSDLVDNDLILHINPTGQFVIGGPHGDTGLTGRKIIVDTYGGKGAHGGGAFSGKDPSRWTAARPTPRATSPRTSWPPGWPTRRSCSSPTPSAWPSRSRSPSTPTARAAVSDAASPRSSRDVRPAPARHHRARSTCSRRSTAPTAAYGHFGRDGFPWERLDRIDELKAKADATTQNVAV